MKERTAEYWVIAILSIGAIYFITLTKDLPSAGLVGGIGPRTFPLGAFWSILALNALLIGSSIFKQLKEKKTGAEQGSEPGKADWLWKIIPRTPVTAVGLILMLLVFAALWEFLGFVIASSLFIFIVSLYLTPQEKRSVSRSLLLAVVFSVLIYFLFTIIFKIPLPQGFFVE